MKMQKCERCSQTGAAAESEKRAASFYCTTAADDTGPAAATLFTCKTHTHTTYVKHWANLFTGPTP